MTEDRAYIILTALRNIKLSISDEMNEQLKPWFEDIEKAIEDEQKVIKALSQEPCTDAVSRDAVLEIICRETEWYDIRTQIELLPPVMQKPKTGHWIESKTYANIYDCSECESTGFYTFKYCPNCGARMESEDKE